MRMDKKYRPEAPFRAYLYRIAANLAMSHLRKRRLRQTLSIDEMIERGFDLPSSRPADDPAGSLESRRLWNHYEAALAKLPAQWRVALELRVTRELSYEEIAGAMGKSVSSIESMLFKARVRIAGELRRAPEREGDA